MGFVEHSDTKFKGQFWANGIFKSFEWFNFLQKVPLSHQIFYIPILLVNFLIYEIFIKLEREIYIVYEKFWNDLDGLIICKFAVQWPQGGRLVQF